MKKLCLLLLLLACLCLAGCGSLLPTQYTRVTPHNKGTSAVRETDEPLTVEDYVSLKQAIQSFAQDGIEHGVIRAYSYDGSVEEDLPKAAYEVAREDPVGAYTIDYMTHDCSMIVSYYEIHIDMTFRSYAAEVSEIPAVSGSEERSRLLRQALGSYADHLTMYETDRSELDYDALTQEYCASDPLHHIAVPKVRVTRYPEEKTPCIVELTFQYPETTEHLREMEQAVEESMEAASVYVRYRGTETEKAKLLFTYLDERFSYRPGQTGTPIYSALCEGIADNATMTQSWQFLCDKIGLNCRTVSGIRGDGSYTWNIMELDGQLCHVDILRNLLESDSLLLRYDSDMEGYFWDTEAYPACVEPIPEETEPETQEDLPEEGEPAEEPEEESAESTEEP